MRGEEQMVEGQANVGEIMIGEVQDMEEGQANVKEILMGGREENVEGQADENTIPLQIFRDGGLVANGEIQLCVPSE